ncbi:Transcription initiation factor IIE subunit alpha [Sphaceloma murrayae]|uniref:Transcription initiation factor IIE subunit alpha n=1 Tax=Sphaceloma murrayae TaxID=2082308 RepID=A0A2K1QWL7_9PEZI|nr:Transcription initiation factor IIE subunit alpha [Sphaceloma murrayae]
MDLAQTLVRTVVRAFYTTEHILIIDALNVHGTLTDSDLAHLLGMQTKALRKFCGKLKEDGLISVQPRGEKKEGAPPAWQTHNGNSQPKERLFFRDWYYINFHRAIDSIKYRLHKLSRHIEQQGASTSVRKELGCPRCKATYTTLEVMDTQTALGEFTCHRCGHTLQEEEDNEGPAENESMKRMNSQLSKIVDLMRKIDSTNVPENDAETAYANRVLVERPDSNPGAQVTVVHEAKPQIASSKGLTMAPEKVSVNLTDGKVDPEEEARERKKAAQKAKEASQNALPEWITKSTLTGELTKAGQKEIDDRKKRGEDGVEWIGDEVGEEDGKKDVGETAALESYFDQLRKAQEAERRGENEGSEEEDEDEDDFEDVVMGDAKRVKVEDGPSTSNGVKKEENIEGAEKIKEEPKDDGKVSDADDDDDELEFEDV